MLEYIDVERSLRREAETIVSEGRSWKAATVSERLIAIADMLQNIRKQHAGGIDASMGKRSGNQLEP